MVKTLQPTGPKIDAGGKNGKADKCAKMVIGKMEKR